MALDLNDRSSRYALIENSYWLPQAIGTARRAKAIHYVLHYAEMI